MKIYPLRSEQGFHPKWQLALHAKELLYLLLISVDSLRVAPLYNVIKLIPFFIGSVSNPGSVEGLVDV